MSKTNPQDPAPRGGRAGEADLAVPPLPAVSAALGDASIATDDFTLLVRAGDLRRQWRWTGRGLATTELSHTASGTVWRAAATPTDACDWQLPDGTEPPPGAMIADLQCRLVHDDRFTAGRSASRSVRVHGHRGPPLPHGAARASDPAGSRFNLALSGYSHSATCATHGLIGKTDARDAQNVTRSLTGNRQMRAFSE